MSFAIYRRAGLRLRALGAQRRLLADIPDLGREVVPVLVLDLLGRDAPEPEEERDFWGLEILAEPPRGVDERLLKHVGGIHAPREAMVEPKLHHPAQATPVLLKDRRQPFLSFPPSLAAF
jgi:hypothetical protein